MAPAAAALVAATLLLPLQPVLAASATTVLRQLRTTAVECDPGCGPSNSCCDHDKCSSEYPVSTKVKGDCCFLWVGDCHTCCKAPPAPPRPPPPAPPGRALPPVPPAPPMPPLRPTAGAPRPHLVLFVVDDMGWAALGARNPGHVLTPNMDREASNGIMLERHYTYRWCSPTRSSLMTGRLPYHVLQSTNYVERRYNMIAAKLKQVGYSTHQFGKWHMGAVAPWMTPHGRGFDTSLGYLSGGEDHYTQIQRGNIFGGVGVDLYETDAPAYTHNGTYACYTYNDAILKTIALAHNQPVPLFLYIALQVR